LAAGVTVGIAVDLFTRGRWPFLTLPPATLAGQWPGIAFPVLVVLTVAALLALARGQGVRPAWRNLWLLAPLAFLAAMVAVRANPFLTFMNIALCVGLLVLVAEFFAAGSLAALPLAGYVRVATRSVAATVARPPGVLARAVDATRLRRCARSRPLAVVRGVLLALPVLFVFTAMLASADLVFAQRLQDLLDLGAIDEKIVDWSWRGAVALCASWLVTGGLAHALRGRVGPRSGSGQPGADAAGPAAAVALPAATLPRIVGVTEAGTVLALVAVLFTTFVWMQFTYLFGGAANIRAAGFTYAEYARRGFFELIVVAVLSLGLVLALRELAGLRGRACNRVFNALGTVIMALVLVMLASAFQRLRLYEAAYGYTLMRVLSHVFIVWLGLLLAWTGAVLWRHADRFAVGALAAALGFAVTANLLNPDAFIAARNIARYERALQAGEPPPEPSREEGREEGGEEGGEEGREERPEVTAADAYPWDAEPPRVGSPASATAIALDVHYLGGLSADATPILVRARDHALDTRIAAAAAAALQIQAASSLDSAPGWARERAWWRYNAAWYRALDLWRGAPAER